MSETFDLAIHLGPGVAQLKDNKSNLNIDRDNVDGDSETGQLTSKPKKGYFSIKMGSHHSHQNTVAKYFCNINT